MVCSQSIIWVFLLNNFSRIINLLLTKLARDRPGRISALGLCCTDLAALGPYCQDLGPIFSQYGPRAWLIRYIYMFNTNRSNIIHWVFNYSIWNITRNVSAFFLRSDRIIAILNLFFFLQQLRNPLQRVNMTLI